MHHICYIFYSYIWKRLGAIDPASPMAVWPMLSIWQAPIWKLGAFLCRDLHPIDTSLLKCLAEGQSFYFQKDATEKIKNVQAEERLLAC